MICPKCNNQNLRKRGFDSPFNCSTCGGMWLEYENLPNFIKSLKSSINTQTDKNLNDEKTGLCPSGHGILLRAKIDIDEPFFLEKCGTCGGIWFDNGEWQRIANNNLSESISEFWCRSWQIKQSKEKSRKNYLKINRNFLGSELFEELMRLSEILKKHPEKGRAIALLQQEILK
jgi:Zn-finger nucleic acid-binding protein